MSGTTPIAALPYKTLVDSPNANLLSQDLAVALDSLLVPRYTTVSNRNAAIPSPIEGQEAYTADTKELYLYNGTAWVSARPRVAFNTSDFTVTDSITLTDITGLGVSVEANSKYVFDGWVWYTSNSNSNDFAFTLTAPSGATGGWSANGSVGTANTENSGVIWVGYRAFAAAVTFDSVSAGNLVLQLRGMIITSSTSGNLQAQCAEGTAVAGVTTVTAKLGSHINVRKIA